MASEKPPSTYPVHISPAATQSHRLSHASSPWNRHEPEQTLSWPESHRTRHPDRRPFASRICAEFGAEVIKVESPDGGDPLRKWRKLYEGTSLWWFVQARNKQSITLNLKHEAGREVLKKLLSDADILIENFRPGVLEKLGLGWDVLHALNPKLVMVRLSGFGQSGPMKDQPGFGAVGESMGGLRYITGFRGSPAGAHRHLDWRFDCRAVGRDRCADGAAPSRSQRRPGPGGGCGAVRGDLRHDGVHDPGVRRVRLYPRAQR